MIRSTYHKEEIVEICSVTKGENHHYSWIFDCGCDLHMCHSRDSSYTNESYHGESAFMENNAKRKALKKEQ